MCGNVEGHHPFVAREMMFGTGDEFHYIECSSCGGLQIVRPPEDLSEYYPTRYYSMTPADPGLLRRWLRRMRARHALGHRSVLGAFLVRRFGEPRYVDWVRRGGADFDSAILDVGSGAGELLLEMKDAGFRRLVGIDPFVEGSRIHDAELRIEKRGIHDVEGPYDFVMLHHSLEHTAEPGDILVQVHRILRPGGVALVRIPVAACWAWREYGANWVQLDAPRHLTIPSDRGMRILSERAGLKVRDVVFDSDSFQIWGSEQYRQRIPLRSRRSHAEDVRASPFSPEIIQEYESRARSLNREQQGDQACFYLQRADS